MDNISEDMYDLSRDLLSGTDPLDKLVIRPLGGGGNNKVFILELRGLPKYVMKHYFRHPSDPRDRCRAEWTFLEYAVNAGISCVPKPVTCDPDRGVAIYEYIEGQKISAEHLNGSHIVQALDFFASLNQKNNADASRSLLPASESCFSMKEHLECVNSRIDRLLHMDEESEIDRSAVRFVRDELIPGWEKVREGILNQGEKGIFRIGEPLPERDICISPSDFGFHNAIRTDTGRVFFIDFEYAGSDDPVKMICDFFCQPEVPIPRPYLPMFSSRVLERLDNPEAHYQRMKVLLPVHTLKWCCIILNEFLPVGRARRIFANKDMDIDAIKRNQLIKAKNMFEKVSAPML